MPNAIDAMDAACGAAWDRVFEDCLKAGLRLTRLEARNVGEGGPLWSVEADGVGPGVPRVVRSAEASSPLEAVVSLLREFREMRGEQELRAGTRARA